MTPLTAPLMDIVDELLALLKRETDMLTRRYEQMAELYDLILSNNDQRMEDLLGEMAATQQRHAALDEDLAGIRGVLARLLDKPKADIRLAELAKEVDEQRAEIILTRRHEIIALAEKLKIQHLDTALVLSEASRMNRLLLDGLFPQTGEVRTYGSDGKKGWRNNTGLVDAEL